MPVSDHDMRLTTAAEREALKRATQRSIHLGGTQCEVARFTRINQAHLSRCANWRNPANADDFVPIDVAIDLDRQAGEPLIAKAMIAAQGYIAIRLPEVDGECADAKQAASTIKELGEVLTAIGADLADGEIGNDLGQLDEVIKQGGEGLEALTAFLQAMKERRSHLVERGRS